MQYRAPESLIFLYTYVKERFAMDVFHKTPSYVILNMHYALWGIWHLLHEALESTNNTNISLYLTENASSPVTNWLYLSFHPPCEGS